jgi:hypothetical protein
MQKDLSLILYVVRSTNHKAPYYAGTAVYDTVHVIPFCLFNIKAKIVPKSNALLLTSPLVKLTHFKNS